MQEKCLVGKKQMCDHMVKQKVIMTSQYSTQEGSVVVLLYRLSPMNNAIIILKLKIILF